MQAINNDVTFGVGQPSPVPSETNESAATAASDFQSFLLLLTAQLRNQDPLSPLDSTQFVEQLASFSAVEQQIETNSKLDALTERLSVSAIDEASQWIGKDVEATSGAAHFEGAALSYLVPEGAPGTTTEIVVSDLAGNVVYSEQAGSQRREFTWRGENGEGGTAPNGDYVVSINRYNEGELVEVAQPIAFTRVIQARFEETGVRLVLENGAIVSPSEIAALRSAPSASQGDASDVLPGDV